MPTEKIVPMTKAEIEEIGPKLQDETIWEIKKAVKLGLKTLIKPKVVSLSEWLDEHFYLSPESSYIQGRWKSLPYQAAILGLMGNDDIRSVAVLKSARIGATKMMMGAIAYNAHHKRRNQAIWQPTDGDSENFVKSEIDPMIRDVSVMQDIFPWGESKHKNNTMQLKMFIGSSLHILGGKAAKNYRRISVDIGYLDELSKFDRNIENEGSPVELSRKRVEGAIFPKMIYCSTPKIQGDCLMSDVYNSADIKFEFYIPCPHCGIMKPLKFGGKDCNYGFKWEKGKPETVVYLCSACACVFTQEEFIEVSHKGQLMSEDGHYSDLYGAVFDKDGTQVDVRNVGVKIWTGYSPMVEWSGIVRDFLGAKHDPRLLQSFVNLTLGEVWEVEQGDKIDAKGLQDMIIPYNADVPNDVVLLTGAIDVQDDRVEYGVKGWGKGEESWWIDYKVKMGDLSRPEFWIDLGKDIKLPYSYERGGTILPRLFTIDSGGHFTDEVYGFCRNMGRAFCIPTKGSSVMGMPVFRFPQQAKNGVYLTMVGTDTAKDIIMHRMSSFNAHGHGNIHFPDAAWCNSNFFAQLTAESRKPRYDKNGALRFDWHCPHGKRNEAWDIAVLNLVAVRLLQQQFGVSLEADPTPVHRVKRRIISNGVW